MNTQATRTVGGRLTATAQRLLRPGRVIAATGVLNAVLWFFLGATYVSGRPIFVHVATVVEATLAIGLLGTAQRHTQSRVTLRLLAAALITAPAMAWLLWFTIILAAHFT